MLTFMIPKERKWTLTSYQVNSISLSSTPSVDTDTTSHISGNSTIKISTKRMEEKDKSFQTLNISDPLATQSVLVAKRLDLLKRRGRAPIIYHQVSANKSYSVLFMDMRVYTRDEGEYEDKAIDPPK